MRFALEGITSFILKHKAAAVQAAFVSPVTS
jgi:hypothetical protein